MATFARSRAGTLSETAVLEKDASDSIACARRALSSPSQPRPLHVVTRAGLAGDKALGLKSGEDIPKDDLRESLDGDGGGGDENEGERHDHKSSGARVKKLALLSPGTGLFFDKIGALLKLEEAAKLIRVQPRTFYEWRYDKSVPRDIFIVINGRLRIRMDSLASWILSQNP